MKSFINSVIAATSLFVTSALGQTNLPPVPVKGTIAIKFDSRLNSTPTKGVVDTYDVAVNVGNSVLFTGKITDRPQIIDGWVNKTVVQSRAVTYDVATDVINPRNVTQTKNVGKLYGKVPISSDGVYDYDAGSLEISVLPVGNAGGFTSKFRGKALGKPLVRPAGWLENMKKEAVNITRKVGGKVTTVVLKKYDKMEYRQVTLSAGPVAMYQEVTLNGEFLYDYEKNCWFLNNVTAQYVTFETNSVSKVLENVVRVDRLGGTIRYVESPNRKVSGEGEYQFDIRVNEPIVNQSAIFAAPSGDESSFFETDNSSPSLTGTMKYKDTLKDGVTLASNVIIDLVGNNITKQQTMVLVKTLIFSAVVPMNAD